MYYNMDITPIMTTHTEQIEYKPFSLKYTNIKTGIECIERPRLMISVDGKTYNLVIGNGDDMTFIATGNSTTSNNELWCQAREWVKNYYIRQTIST